MNKAIFALEREGSSREQSSQQGAHNSLVFLLNWKQLIKLALVGVRHQECVAEGGTVLYLGSFFTNWNIFCFSPAPAAPEGQFHGGARWGGSQTTSRLSFYWSVPVCQAQKADWRVRFPFWSMCFASQQSPGFSQQQQLNLNTPVLGNQNL